jgi:DedD protein
MQKDQVDQVDQGLSFKKRARRRLVGAIALVFLMIIFLPMVLEDREKSIQQENIEIVMPNEQSSDDDIATAVVGLELDADDDELVANTVTTNESSTNNGQDSAKAKEKSLPAMEAPTKLANVEKIQNTAPPKHTPAGNKYYVQIGVFSDPSNITKLQTKLNDLGYKSLTEKITTDTGVKTRLRTESFTDRNEAAIALENIKDAGLAGMVVNQK